MTTQIELIKISVEQARVNLDLAEDAADQRVKNGRLIMAVNHLADAAEKLLAENETLERRVAMLEARHKIFLYTK